MLKLEKNKNHEIHIQFRKRSGLFTRTFLMAFGMAIGLHALAGVVFRIHSFLNTEDAAHPPVVVEIDMNNGGEIAVVLDEAAAFREIAPPPLSSPFNGVFYHLSSLDCPAIEMPDMPLPATAFLLLEEDLQYLVRHTPKRLTPVTVHLSGEISDLAVKQSLPDESTRVKIDAFHQRHPSHEAFLSYAVKVEGTSGTIFWQDCRSSVEDAETVRLAEDILKNIRFAPYPGIVDGTIELSFFSDEGFQ